jgi:hypothetical protein
MAEERETPREERETETEHSAAEQAIERAARRMAEMPEDVLRVGGGTGNFGRGDRSMFDPAAEEEPEDPGNLDGSLPPEDR